MTEERKMLMFKFLMAMNVVMGPKMYMGTVSPQVKAKRRSLNLRQKASRRANRGK